MTEAAIQDVSQSDSGGVHILTFVICDAVYQIKWRLQNGTHRVFIKNLSLYPLIWVIFTLSRPSVRLKI